MAILVAFCILEAETGSLSANCRSSCSNSDIFEMAFLVERKSDLKK
jgi:hypothetical protein